MSSAQSQALRAGKYLIASMLCLSAAATSAQTLQKTVITLDGNGNGLFEVGETVQYTLTFTNTGSTDLDGAEIRDQSTSCLQIDISSVVIEPTSGGIDGSSGNDVQVAIVSPLRPGEAVTITFTASATSVGECCNQATWTAPGRPGGVSDRNPTDIIPNQPTCHFVTQETGLEYDAVIDKTVLTAGCIAPGSRVAFHVRLQHTGTRPLRNATVVDWLPSGFTDVIVDGPLQYDAAQHRVYANLGTYGVGQGEDFTYQATIPCTIAGTLLNTATFTSEDNSGNMITRSDTAAVSWGMPEMGDSTKTWSDDPTDGDSIVLPGETVTFEITVRNTGDCEALNVIVADALDPRFVSSFPTLVISDGGAYDAGTGRIVWDETTTPQLAAMPSNSSMQLRFSTQVEPGTAEGGFIPNSVIIEPTGNPLTCPALPSMARTISLRLGDVAYGNITPDTILLRNDYISCLDSAFNVMRTGGPSGIPILRERNPPQICSLPPAINIDHPETNVFVNPVSPLVLGDSFPTVDRCPQRDVGGGRILIFYEFQDDCTNLLRVTKSPTGPWNVILTW